MPWLWAPYIIVLLELKPSSAIASHQLHSEAGRKSDGRSTPLECLLTVSHVPVIYGTQVIATWNDRFHARNEVETGQSVDQYLSTVLCV